MVDQSSSCEAHRFMTETIREIKTMTSRVVESHQALEKTVVKLTENLDEVRRTNERLDKLIADQKETERLQNEAIDKNKAFTDKALGAIGLLAIGLPIVLTVVQIVLSK